MRGESKGITQSVTLAGSPVTNWQIYSLPMTTLPKKFVILTLSERARGGRTPAFRQMSQCPLRQEKKCHPDRTLSNSERVEEASKGERRDLLQM